MTGAGSEFGWRMVAEHLAAALRRLWRVYAGDNLDPSEPNPKPPPWIAEPLEWYKRKAHEDQ
jgi:hypothetical protein